MHDRLHCWGNATYADLAVGEVVVYRGRTVVLRGMAGNRCTVAVEGDEAELVMARRGLPVVVGGLRVFLADTRDVAGLTTDTFTASTRVHGAMTRDALLCLSDPSAPLLDADRYTFPICRRDGFRWAMAEDSHMHAYLGATRSHEGLDMDMHDMLELHPLVAVEDAVVRVVRDQRNGCIILESRRQPGVYYIYQHANGSPGRCFVAAGQRVARGERLAYAWGDGRWGHLHFAVRISDTEPPFAQRFNNIVNAFPQCYELWHGDLAPRPRVYTTGHWRLHTANYWETRNQGFRSGFDEIVGYGWRLGAWCPADVVECESEPQDRANPARSLRLRTTLHEGLSARATNPEDHYDFVVCVPNGQYGVRAVLGDLRLPTRQHVAFNGEDVGTYDLAAGTFVSTPETRVCVSDGRLVVRIGQADAIQYSAISELHFAKTDGHAS